MAGVGGAMSFGTDGYLQVASPHHSRHNKITKFRCINNIALNPQLLAIFIDSFVELLVTRCSYN